MFASNATRAKRFLSASHENYLPAEQFDESTRKALFRKIAANVSALYQDKSTIASLMRKITLAHQLSPGAYYPDAFALYSPAEALEISGYKFILLGKIPKSLAEFAASNLEYTIGYRESAQIFFLYAAQEGTLQAYCEAWFKHLSTPEKPEYFQILRLLGALISLNYKDAHGEYRSVVPETMVNFYYKAIYNLVVECHDNLYSIIQPPLKTLRLQESERVEAEQIHFRTMQSIIFAGVENLGRLGFNLEQLLPIVLEIIVRLNQSRSSQNIDIEDQISALLDVSSKAALNAALIQTLERLVNPEERAFLRECEVGRLERLIVYLIEAAEKMGIELSMPWDLYERFTAELPTLKTNMMFRANPLAGLLANLANPQGVELVSEIAITDPSTGELIKQTVLNTNELFVAAEKSDYVSRVYDAYKIANDEDRQKLQASILSLTSPTVGKFIDTPEVLDEILAGCELSKASGVFKKIYPGQYSEYLPSGLKARMRSSLSDDLDVLVSCEPEVELDPLLLMRLNEMLHLLNPDQIQQLKEFCLSRYDLTSGEFELNHCFGDILVQLAPVALFCKIEKYSRQANIQNVLPLSLAITLLNALPDDEAIHFLAIWTEGGKRINTGLSINYAGTLPPLTKRVKQLLLIDGKYIQAVQNEMLSGKFIFWHKEKNICPIVIEALHKLSAIKQRRLSELADSELIQHPIDRSREVQQFGFKVFNHLCTIKRSLQLRPSGLSDYFAKFIDENILNSPEKTQNELGDEVKVRDMLLDNINYHFGNRKRLKSAYKKASEIVKLGHGIENRYDLRKALAKPAQYLETVSYHLAINHSFTKQFGILLASIVEGDVAFTTGAQMFLLYATHAGILPEVVDVYFNYLNKVDSPNYLNALRMFGAIVQLTYTSKTSDQTVNIAPNAMIERYQQLVCGLVVKYHQQLFSTALSREVCLRDIFNGKQLYVLHQLLTEILASFAAIKQLKLSMPLVELTQKIVEIAVILEVKNNKPVNNHLVITDQSEKIAALLDEAMLADLLKGLLTRFKVSSANWDPSQLQSLASMMHLIIMAANKKGKNITLHISGFQVIEQLYPKLSEFLHNVLKKLAELVDDDRSSSMIAIEDKKMSVNVKEVRVLNERNLAAPEYVEALTKICNETDAQDDKKDVLKAAFSDTEQGKQNLLKFYDSPKALEQIIADVNIKEVILISKPLRTHVEVETLFGSRSGEAQHYLQDQLAIALDNQMVLSTDPSQFPRQSLNEVANGFYYLDKADQQRFVDFYLKNFDIFACSDFKEANVEVFPRLIRYNARELFNELKKHYYKFPKSNLDFIYQDNIIELLNRLPETQAEEFVMIIGSAAYYIFGRHESTYIRPLAMHADNAISRNEGYMQFMEERILTNASIIRSFGSDYPEAFLSALKMAFQRATMLSIFRCAVMPCRVYSYEERENSFAVKVAFEVVNLMVKSDRCNDYIVNFARQLLSDVTDRVKIRELHDEEQVVSDAMDLTM